MGRSYGVICSACQTKFMVGSGGGRLAYTVGCDACGETKSVWTEEGRRSRRGPPTPGDRRLVVLEKLKQETAREVAWREGRRRSLPGAAWFARRSLANMAELKARAKGLAEEEAARIKAEHVCPCGGTFTRGYRQRCPSCRSTEHTRDPTAPEIMVD